MARLPRREDLGDLPDPGSTPIATVDASRVGQGQRALSLATANVNRGVTAIGKAAFALNAKRKAQEGAINRYVAKRKLAELEFKEDQALDEAMKNAEPGAENFTETHIAGVQERFKEHFKDVPQNLRPSVDATLFSKERSIFGRAKTFERGEQKRFSGQQLDQELETGRLRDARNSTADSIDEVAQAHSEAIEENPYLTTIEKDTRLTEDQRQIAAAFLDSQDESSIQSLMDLGPKKRAKVFMSLKDKDWQDALRRAETRGKVGDRELRSELKDTISTAKEGILPGPATMEDLEARVKASGDPEAAELFNEANLTAVTHNTASGMRVTELEKGVNGLRTSMGKKGGTREELDRLKVAESVLSKAKTELKKDPVAWAEKTRLIDETSLDFESPETLAATLKVRVPIAEQVGEYHHVAPKYLKEEELATLREKAREGGPDMLAVAAGIVNGAQQAAPMVFEELFTGTQDKTSMGMAMIGGLLTTVGEVQVARDAADGYALRQSENFKTRGPKPTDLRDAVTPVFGDVFSELPKSEQAAIQVALAAYEIRSRREGVETFDKDLFGEILTESLGQREIGEETFGGILDQNATNFFGDSANIMIPANVSHDNFSDVIASIRIEDLADDRPRFGDGKTTIGMSDLRRGKLKSVGDGQYWVMMGSKDNPEYLTSKNTGDKWVLNLKALEPVLRGRRPDLYLGGRP